MYNPTEAPVTVLQLVIKCIDAPPSKSRWWASPSSTVLWVPSGSQFVLGWSHNVPAGLRVSGSSPGFCHHLDVLTNHSNHLLGAAPIRGVSP